MSFFKKRWLDDALLLKKRSHNAFFHKRSLNVFFKKRWLDDVFFARLVRDR